MSTRENITLGASLAAIGGYTYVAATGKVDRWTMHVATERQRAADIALLKERIRPIESMAVDEDGKPKDLGEDPFATFFDPALELLGEVAALAPTDYMGRPTLQPTEFKRRREGGRGIEFSGPFSVGGVNLRLLDLRSADTQKWRHMGLTLSAANGTQCSEISASVAIPPSHPLPSNNFHIYREGKNSPRDMRAVQLVTVRALQGSRELLRAPLRYRI